MDPNSIIPELLQPPIAIELDRFMLLVLIGQIQLALRHPENTGPPADIARSFIQQAREQMRSEPGSPLDQLIIAGFDETQDLPGILPTAPMENSS